MHLCNLHYVVLLLMRDIVPVLLIQVISRAHAASVALAFSPANGTAAIRGDRRRTMSTTPRTASLDVRDFPSLQDAVDTLPSTGGTIHIPAGTTCSLSAAITVSKPIWF